MATDSTLLPETLARGRRPALASFAQSPALWLGLASLWLSLRLFQWARLDLVIDDAWVLFRYARNFADGFGPVFNAGERVEGYVCFLWVAVLALGDLLGADLAIFAGLLSYAATLGTIWLLYRLALVLDPTAKPLVAVLPAVLYALSPAPARYIGSGMETSFFVFAVTLSLYLYVSGAQPFVVGMAGALCALTRPEGVLYCALLAAFELLVGREPADWRRRLRNACWIGAGGAALYLPYFAWRWAYYGYPLPNVFYAKVGGPGTALLGRGWKFFLEAARQGSYELPAALALVGLARYRRERLLWLLAATIVLTAAYFVLVGGDFTALFGPRFLVPACPALLLLAVLPVRWLMERPGRGLRSAGAALLAVALAVNAVAFGWPGPRDRLAYMAASQRGWIEIGRWLEAHSPPAATLAVGAAGAMPFFAERYTIDMLGLNDLHIAHREMPLGWGYPGHEKFDTGYVLDRNPDYVVFMRVDTRGTPMMVGDWKQYKERFLGSYQLAALAYQLPNPEGLPWVIEPAALEPELLKKGYLAAVYRRHAGDG